LSPLEKEELIVTSLYLQDNIDETLEGYLRGDFPISGLPIDIGRYIELLGLKRTHSEEKRSRGYKDRMSLSLERKYGIKVSNVSQVPEIKLKIKEASRSNYPHQKEAMLKGYLDYLSDPERVSETVSKIEETCLRKYGAKNFGQGEEAKEKAAASRKSFFEGMTYQERLERTSAAREAICHRGGYSSKLEKRVRSCLESLGIFAKYNVHLWNYNFDAVWDNKILEVQGDMWHANPLLFKEDDLIMGKILARHIWEKDKKKKEVAKENGFFFYEIWEHEINSCKTEDQLSKLIQKRIPEK
jgi:hypothetical protein